MCFLIILPILCDIELYCVTKLILLTWLVFLYIHTNLPVNAIVRLLQARSGDSQDQEKYLTLPADNKTHNYDTECSNHHPSQLTLMSKGLNRSKMKWWAIYTNLTVNTLIRLSYPRSGDNQGQETFLAPSADNRIHNYDTECSNHHPSLSTLRSKGLSLSKMKWWAIYTNFRIT